MFKARSPSFVVVISGTSGSGKTALVQKVTELLGDATSFYADDYASLARQPVDLAEWLEEGADLDRFANPELLQALSTLRNGTPISLAHRGKIQPASFIVMEEPFGRERPEVDELVNFVACIDLPLEIALARKLLREIEGLVEGRGPEGAIDHLRAFLSGYLNGHVRDVYFEVQRKAQQSCDLILDGTKPLDELAEEVVKAVKTKSRESQENLS